MVKTLLEGPLLAFEASSHRPPSSALGKRGGYDAMRGCQEGKFEKTGRFTF
jgi:hypothetical protein